MKDVMVMPLLSYLGFNAKDRIVISQGNNLIGILPGMPVLDVRSIVLWC